jgi:sodium transport system permease protein
MPSCRCSGPAKAWPLDAPIVSDPLASSVQRVLTVARKELLDTLRDRRTLMVTLLPALIAGPLILLLMFSMLSSQLSKVRELQLPTVGREHAPALVAFLERQQVTLVSAPSDHDAKVRAGELDVVLVIDANFERDVEEGKAGTVRLIYDRSRDRAQAAIREVEGMLRAYNRQWGSQRLLLRGIAPTVGNPLDVESTDLATPQQSGAFLLFFLAYYGLFAAVMGGMAVALDVTAGERERQSLEPLLMTPARPSELVVGKWLAVVAFDALIVVVTLTGYYLTLRFAPLPAVGIPFLFGARELAWFLVVLLPLIALLPAVMLFMGARSRTFKEAQASVSLVIFIVSIIPVVQLVQQKREPDWISWVPVSGQFSLLSQVLRGESLSLAQLASSFATPALLAVLVLLLVTRMLSRESILAGK